MITEPAGRREGAQKGEAIFCPAGPSGLTHKRGVIDTGCVFTRNRVLDGPTIRYQQEAPLSGRIDMRTRLFTLIATSFLIASAVPASAGWVNELGRNLGLGWSDGYHAYEGCPDPRLRSQPWQRRSNRSVGMEEPLVPYLAPTPAARPEPQPLPTPQSSRAPTSIRNSQLRITQPNY